MDEQVETLMQRAQALHEVRPEWTLFFREILGVNGLVRLAFQGEELRQFEQSDYYQEILHMLADLRREEKLPEVEEPPRVITVRLPRALHESLRLEAHHKQTSLNKLCISKLMQPIPVELVPKD